LPVDQPPSALGTVLGATNGQWRKVEQRPVDTQGDACAERRRRSFKFAVSLLKVLEDVVGRRLEDVKVVDVATPMTYVRYTGNWKGSPDGWYVNPENMKCTPNLTLPGLSDFFMTGPWTAPFAGTVISALTGRQVIEILCNRVGVPFRASS